MAPIALELIFLHLTPRLYFQRIIIISSLMLVSINVQWVIPLSPWVVIFALIAAHNIMSAFNVPFFYGAIDMVLLIAEVIGAGKYAARQFFKTWIPQTYLFHVVLGWVIVVSLSAAISMRIGIAIRTKGRSLITPFTLLGDHPPTSRETKPFNLLLGRSIWRKNFVGEVLSIRTIRGILALIILAAIFFFMLLKVIFAPVKETALSPVREYRIPGYTPWDLYEEIYVPTWNVIYPLALQDPVNGNTNLSTLISADDFFFAVNVTAVWPDHINRSLTPDCVQEFDSYNDLPVYIYRCEPAWLDNETYFLLPGLEVDVDFGLLSPSLSQLKNASPRMNLPLVFSLMNSTIEGLRYTMPTVMMPGTNMAASVVTDIRQVYSRPLLAALGMFELMETFWMPRFVNFYPDPFAAFTGPNRSSLNIFSQDNYGELRFVQDFRQNSVIDGFASVGGLWTAFSGIFAIIFGATMLHTLYGTKPLSIFGVAHSFQSEEMKRECLRLYPNILKEDSVPEQRGLLSLLRDHLIDLSFLEADKPKISPLPPPPQDEEKANIVVDSPEAPQPVLGYHPDGDRTSGSQTASDTGNKDTSNTDAAPWPRGPRGPRKTL